MKKYRVKIGQLYIYDISTDEEFVNTNFIENIELHSEKDCSYTVSEDEKENLRRILKDVLKLLDSYNEIQFEEVED